MTENRLIVMRKTSIQSLILFSVFCSLALGSLEYHFVDLLRSYEEAKSYCREMYTDLATVPNSEHMQNMIALVSNKTTRAWIGLESRGVWMWHWSLLDQKTDFFKWRFGEPQENNQDACAVMDLNGEWFESDCGTERKFVCQDNGDTGGHLFVAEAKSWRNAQSHCRDLSSDLVSIHSAEENTAVQNVSASQNVWIGLFKDPWIWSDGSNSSFRFWKPFQPNYLTGQNCTAAVFKDGKWNDLKCSGKRRFVCHGARKSTITTTTANSRSTAATFTTNYTVTLTSLPMTSDYFASTADPTTSPEVFTSTTAAPNTTPFVSSTDLSNATTQTPNATASTETVSAAATQPINQMSTINTWHSGNVILIQKNMTWIEAMSYCREHHVDLVHVTTKGLQDEVAEKAKDASSAHVWLGLRYACKFNSWFWLRSTPGCYQNWAPGHGPERQYDCGASGAAEATGRQRWVGLPETEKLNFMCSTCDG